MLIRLPLGWGESDCSGSWAVQLDLDIGISLLSQEWEWCRLVRGRKFVTCGMVVRCVLMKMNVLLLVNALHLCTRLRRYRWLWLGDALFSLCGWQYGVADRPHLSFVFYLVFFSFVLSGRYLELLKSSEVEEVQTDELFVPITLNLWVVLIVCEHCCCCCSASNRTDGLDESPRLLNPWMVRFCLPQLRQLQGFQEVGPNQVVFG